MKKEQLQNLENEVFQSDSERNKWKTEMKNCTSKSKLGMVSPTRGIMKHMFYQSTSVGYCVAK
jgi:hypothetical protein